MGLTGDCVDSGWHGGYAASLVSGCPPVASITRYLATTSRHQLREAIATFESHGPEVCKVHKEQVPGLATETEQVQHLLNMAAVDDAAEEARRKRRASSCPPVAAAAPDHRVKLRKVEDGGKAMVPAGVASF